MRVDTAEVLEHRKSCAATNAVIVSGANTEKGEGRKLPGARTRPPAAPYPVEVCKAPMATTMSGENGRHIFREIDMENMGSVVCRGVVAYRCSTSATSYPLRQLGQNQPCPGTALLAAVGAPYSSSSSSCCSRFFPVNTGSRNKSTSLDHITLHHIASHHHLTL
jgi:hypothetical protein